MASTGRDHGRHQDISVIARPARPLQKSERIGISPPRYGPLQNHTFGIHRKNDKINSKTPQLRSFRLACIGPYSGSYFGPFELVPVRSSGRQPPSCLKSKHRRHRMIPSMRPGGGPQRDPRLKCPLRAAGRRRSPHGCCAPRRHRRCGTTDMCLSDCARRSEPLRRAGRHRKPPRDLSSRA